MIPGGAITVPRSGVKDGEINQGTGKSQLLWLQRWGGEEKKENKTQQKPWRNIALQIHILTQSKEAKSSSKPLPAAWGSHWGCSEDLSPLSTVPPADTSRSLPSRQSDAAEELRQKEKSRLAPSCPVPLRSAAERKEMLGKQQAQPWNGSYTAH
ncbi:small integral membrane protein 32 isoform X2 [Tympanuchus pallidicinctus]|uniref:small integral membrane protein 32 isoform X2 n=1 Tax=Tympanuchus pallidicinctus TaxID=109042 RepID=UPI002287228E|nr:small integral membrane protein 32 isoform X2 [Tympanuchus pallidicinctus]